MGDFFAAMLPWSEAALSNLYNSDCFLGWSKILWQGWENYYKKSKSDEVQGKHQLRQTRKKDSSCDFSHMKQKSNSQYTHCTVCWLHSVQPLSPLYDHSWNWDQRFTVWISDLTVWGLLISTKHRYSTSLLGQASCLHFAFLNSKFRN